MAWLFEEKLVEPVKGFWELFPGSGGMFNVELTCG